MNLFRKMRNCLLRDWRVDIVHDLELVIMIVLLLISVPAVLVSLGIVIVTILAARDEKDKGE